MCVFQNPSALLSYLLSMALNSCPGHVEVNNNLFAGFSRQFIECMLVWESTRFGNVFECMLVWERVRNMRHTFSHVFVNNLNICSGIVWKSLEQS